MSLERHVRIPAVVPFAAVLLAGVPILTEVHPASSPPLSDVRIVVLEKDDQDPAAWRACRDLGANVVATLGPPSAQTAAIASATGLTYLAFLTTDEIETFALDPSRVAEARAEPSLAGFYYWDARAPEGFTTPDAQKRSYEALKALFPGKLVLFPTRLDPIAWSAGFLDGYFRPEYSDLVTPYFYPVGSTPLGPAQEQDNWPETLASLLSALAPRVPAGEGLLPILQGFEPFGYPVGSRFLVEQFTTYRMFWPSLSNAGVFAWRVAVPQPLTELADLPRLQRGACSLFAELSSRPARCRWTGVIPFL